MKLTISVSSDTFDLDTSVGSDTLSATEIERLVRLWLMAATDSAAVTQDVIDELTARLASNTNALRDAVEAVVAGGE